MLCATEQYLKNNPKLKHPNDLISHNGLLYQLHDIIHDVWEFAEHGKPIKVKMQSNRSSNDAELVRRWCVAGKGLAVKSSLDMSHYLLNEKIVSVLTNFAPKPFELWLICPSRQTITPAVRLLREHLRKKCHTIFTQLIDKGILKKEDLQ